MCPTLPHEFSGWALYGNSRQIHVHPTTRAKSNCACGLRRPQALQQLAEGCGPAFAGAATPELRALLFRGLHHPNRFVREAGYHTLAAVCAAAPPGSLGAWGAEAAALLQDGLSENWSQARATPCGHTCKGHGASHRVQHSYDTGAVGMFSHTLFVATVLGGNTEP